MRWWYGRRGGEDYAVGWKNGGKDYEVGWKGGLLILFTRDRDEKVAMLFERFRILSDDVVETEIQFVEGERL